MPELEKASSQLVDSGIEWINRTDFTNDEDALIQFRDEMATLQETTTTSRGEMTDFRNAMQANRGITAPLDRSVDRVSSYLDRLIEVIENVESFAVRAGDIAAERLGDAGINAELSELQVAAREAEQTLPGLESSGERPEVAERLGEVDRLAHETAALAGDQPKAALLNIAAAIERQSREVLSTQQPEARDVSLDQQLHLLDLSPAVRKAADEFQAVRSRIVHGRTASESEVRRAIEIGVELLRTIAGLPHEVNIVSVPKADCYGDAEGRQRHEFQAVVLGAFHGHDLQERAFPHTADQLPAGEPVSWEWKQGRTFSRDLVSRSEVGRDEVRLDWLTRVCWQTAA